MTYEFGSIVSDRSAVVRLEDNVVVNIIVATPNEPAQIGCQLIDVSDGRFCDIGWIWNGTEFYNPNPNPQPSPVDDPIVEDNIQDSNPQPSPVDETIIDDNIAAAKAAAAAAAAQE